MNKLQRNLLERKKMIDTAIQKAENAQKTEDKKKLRQSQSKRPGKKGQ